MYNVKIIRDEDDREWGSPFLSTKDPHHAWDEAKKAMDKQNKTWAEMITKK